MKEEIKQAAEAVASHPKVSLAITAAFTSNAWLDYGEPIIKGLTSIAGLVVVTLLAIKHFIDIRKEWKNKNSNGSRIYKIDK